MYNHINEILHINSRQILNMSAEEDLDMQFSPSRFSRRYRAEEIILKHQEFISKASNIVKRTVPCQLNVPYGSSPKEKLDIFGTDLPNESSIFIYIHGGMWQDLSKELSSYVVKPLHKAKFKVIVLGYDLCPQVTLSEIIGEIQKAFLYCVGYAKANGSRGIYISGHSAGAHLVASLFQTFFSTIPEEDQTLVKAAILISGIYDLTQLQKTYVNNALKLDPLTAKRLSPLLQTHKSNNIPFFIVVGEYESPTFIRQSQSLYTKLRSQGKVVDYMLVKEVDHFDIAENMNEDNYEIIKLITNLPEFEM